MSGPSPEMSERTDRSAVPPRGGGEGYSAEDCTLGVGDIGEMVRRISLALCGQTLELSVI